MKKKKKTGSQLFAATKIKIMINNYKDHHLPSLLHAIEIGSSPSARHSRLTWEHLILDKGGGITLNIIIMVITRMIIITIIITITFKIILMSTCFP